MGFKYFNTARRTIKGYEIMHIWEKDKLKTWRKEPSRAVEIHWTNLWSNCVVASFPKDFSASTSFCNITSKTLPINRFNSSSREFTVKSYQFASWFCQSTSPALTSPRAGKINWMETLQQWSLERACSQMLPLAEIEWKLLLSVVAVSNLCWF